MKGGAIISLAVLVACCALACTALPLDYVRVPGGRAQHKSCVIALNEGDHIHPEDDGSYTVSGPSREVPFHVPACVHPTIFRDSEASPIAGSTPGDGWQVYTYNDSFVGSSSEITSFNGTWNVPSNPSQAGGQLVYLFTGLQNACCGYGLCSAHPSARDVSHVSASFCEIVQPVLQYGSGPAGGGTYYGIANWYVGSTSFFSKLKRVDAGDTLVGNMTINGANAWICSFEDTTSKTVSPPITVSAKDAPTQKVAFVTLEAYSVSSCNEYPTSAVTFTNMALTSTGGNLFFPAWVEAAYSSACGQSVDAENSAEVVINFS